AGKINPRGAKTDLTGATLQIKVNGADLFAPVTSDAMGVGAVEASTTKVPVWFSAATGLYSVTLSGAGLRAAFGSANPAASGLTVLPVRLTIVGAVRELPAANVKLAVVGTAHKFKFSASGLTATGIPDAGADAATVYELALMKEPPVGA